MSVFVSEAEQGCVCSAFQVINSTFNCSLLDKSILTLLSSKTHVQRDIYCKDSQSKPGNSSILIFYFR